MSANAPYYPVLHLPTRITYGEQTHPAPGEETPTTSRLTYLSGFGSFRTPSTVRPVDSTSLPPARKCVKCGAVLRHSNPGPTCCPCAGSFDIPGWAEALVDYDPNALGPIAKAIARTPGYNSPEGVKAAKARNERIRADHATGRYSHKELAARYGVAKSTVQGILYGKWGG